MYVRIIFKHSIAFSFFVLQHNCLGSVVFFTSGVYDACANHSSAFINSQDVNVSICGSSLAVAELNKEKFVTCYIHACMHVYIHGHAYILI